MKIFTQNVFLVQMQTLFEVIKLFVKFHCLSSYQNDFESNISLMNQLFFKNESFCVVCIITYITVVLLFNDGSDIFYM